MPFGRAYPDGQSVLCTVKDLRFKGHVVSLSGLRPARVKTQGRGNKMCLVRVSMMSELLLPSLPLKLAVFGLCNNPHGHIYTPASGP